MNQNAWSIDFAPLLAMPLVWAAAVLAVLVGVMMVALKTRGAWLRALATLALVAALFNPVIINEERASLPTTVAVVVDRTQSQLLDGRAGTTDQALEEITQSLARFDQFDVRIVDALHANADAASTQSNLFATLRSAVRDVPPARVGGAIFITDGQAHDVPASSEELGFDAPIHALITGRADEFDRQLRMVEAPRFAIVGTPVEMQYEIADRGPMPDGSARFTDVEVRLNGELIAIEQALPGEPFPMEITLDRSGANIVEFSTPEVDGEITGNNNRAIVRVEGIRENLRVLLVSGEPHSGERTWRNLLKSDASVDLVHFTILRPPEKQDGTPINELSLIAFPTRELFVEKIEDFDLIIFDRYQNRNVLPVLYYDYITQYVRNGGALLVAAGPEFAGEDSIARTPLLSALPGLPTGGVDEVGYYPRLTEAGQRHPVTRNLEGSGAEPPRWGRWFRTIAVDDIEGTSVMSAADDQPLLILNTVDEGRVGLMLSDHGWLWARGFEGGGPHVSLYRRMAHWLMKEPDLEEEALTAETDGSALTVTRQTMAEEIEPLTITTPSGEVMIVDMEAVEPGLYRTSVDIEEIGLVTMANSDLNALAHIGQVDALEFRDMISTTEVLAATAQASGGTTRRLINDNGAMRVPSVLPVRSSREAAGRDWMGLRTTQETQLLSVAQTPLFSGFLGLAILLLALSSMWYREGK